MLQQEPTDVDTVWRVFREMMAAYWLAVAEQPPAEQAEAARKLERWRRELERWRRELGKVS